MKIAGGRLLALALRARASAVAALALVVLLWLAVQFAGRARPDRFDRAVDDWFTGHVDYRVALWFADLGNGPVIAIAAAVLVVLCAWARYPRGALLAVLAPLCAAGLTEYVIKPWVHRTKGGYLAYPSGHTTGAWTIALVIVLLALGPGRTVLGRAARPVAVAAGLLALACALGLIAANYHYATDVIGGACVAIVVVLALALAIDALFSARLP